MGIAAHVDVFSDAMGPLSVRSGAPDQPLAENSVTAPANPRKSNATEDAPGSCAAIARSPRVFARPNLGTRPTVARAPLSAAAAATSGFAGVGLGFSTVRDIESVRKRIRGSLVKRA